MNDELENHSNFCLQDDFSVCSRNMPSWPGPARKLKSGFVPNCSRIRSDFDQLSSYSFTQFHCYIWILIYVHIHSAYQTVEISVVMFEYWIKKRWSGNPTIKKRWRVKIQVYVFVQVYAIRFFIVTCVFYSRLTNQGQCFRKVSFPRHNNGRLQNFEKS